MWAHQAKTHGLTAENEQRLSLGMTWMDSGKAFVVPFLLISAAMFFLYRARTAPGTLGKAGFALTIIGLVLATVGTAVEFWIFPFGSYELGFEDIAGPAGFGGILQAVSVLLWAAAVLPFGVDLARAKIISGWMVPVMVIAAITSFYLTPATFIPGLGWVIVGAGLWRTSGPAPSRREDRS